MSKYKINFNQLPGFLLLISILFSCSLIEEEDISDEQLTLLAPGNHISTERVTQTFLWESNNDSLSYRIQVVTPGFDAVESVVLDSLLTDNYLEYTLFSGQFEWRVRAENSAYNSLWSYADFFIIDTKDLGSQKVRLRSPIDNLFINEQDISFKWDTLSNVDTYEVRFYSGGWLGNLELDSIDVVESSLGLSIEEGEFWWGMRAINDISLSLFSYNRLIIDLTNPLTPNPLIPEDNFSTSDVDVNFSWNSSDPTWGNVSDSLFIYKITGSSSELFKAKKVSNKNTTVTLDPGSEYKWEVKSVDQAGNQSELSAQRTITINN